ncbi:MAG: HPr(Ser) kinase/phosphatase [Candidatus Hydrogenedentales bacterium]|jgi:HPr kinase/phosphorylase
MDFNALLIKRKNNIPVSRLLDYVTVELDFELLAGFQGTGRPVCTWDVNRPGLALSGYLDYFANDRVQILGNTEIHFMERMEPSVLATVLANMFSFEIPVFVLSRNLTPPAVFLNMCNRNGIPVLRTAMSTAEVISRIILFLSEEFAPETSCHGTAVDVYGIGCLLVGKAGIGKSETALELVERGHRLVADDYVELKCSREDYLYAQMNPVIHHHMEIRGVGIIDVRSIFGVGSVRNSKRIGMVAELEDWDEKTDYDRLGMSEKYVEILGVRIHHMRIPVKPGRNVGIIIEVAALNQRLKEMGISSADQLDKNVSSRNKQMGL